MKAIIEMPKGTSDKIESDKTTGLFRVDRKLSVSVPLNYGFIPNTLAEDGDPLDVFVLGDELATGSLVDVLPVGVFFCEDQGVPDHKILALPETMESGVLLEEVEDVTKYLSTYKPGFRVLGYSSDLQTVWMTHAKTKIRTRRHSIPLQTLLLQLFSLLVFAGALVMAGWLFR